MKQRFSPNPSGPKLPQTMSTLAPMARVTPASSWRRASICAAIALLAMIAMWSLGLAIDPRQVVAGDAHYVFAAARSLAFDGDLDLTNQYWVMGDRWGLGRDPASDGWRLPPREIGPSLLMVPGLWLHHFAGLAPALEPSCACLLPAASLGPCWLACARIIDAVLADTASPRREALAEALAAAAVLGFVGPYYAVGAPGYAHAPDAAISAWLCWALVERRGPGQIGALLACAVLMRLQDLLWLLWPLMEIFADRTTQRRGLPRLAIIVAIASLGLVPQLWLGLAHPGSARGSLGWTIAFFDLQDHGRDLVRVGLGVHGLIRWTPIAGLALLGLGAGALGSQRRPGDRLRSIEALAVLAAMWLLLAAVADVDGGDAFGARRLAGCVGILALGLAQLWRSLQRSAAARVALAITMSALVGANLSRTQRAIDGSLSLGSGAPPRSER